MSRPLVLMLLGVALFGADALCHLEVRPTDQAERSAVCAIPVRPNTVYRLHLRLRSPRGLKSRVFVVECQAESTGWVAADPVLPRHSLGLRSLRPLPPHWQEYEAWFASGPHAGQAELTAAAAREDEAQTGALEVQVLAWQVVTDVRSFPAPSANFVVNGDGERVRPDGVVAAYDRLSREHDARAVAGEGRDGSRAIAITEYYNLTCGVVPAFTFHRYRFVCHARGKGRVNLELRGRTEGHQRADQGAVHEAVEIDGADWQRLEYECVALPGVAAMHAYIHLAPARGETLYLDDISLVVE